MTEVATTTAEVPGARPKLVHVTTVDMSLDVLLGYQLRRFAAAGFEVVGVSAPGPHVAALEADGIRHVPAPHLTRSWTPVTDARALAELRSLLRRERPAIVHTHNPKSGVLGRVAARAARVPVIVNTVHGLYDQEGLSRSRRIAVARAERVAMRLSAQELFQSQEDLERALRDRMVPASRATWLGNGVDLHRFDGSRVDPGAVVRLRAAWGGTPVVGTVGRLVAEKGYPELFDAWRRVRTAHRDAVLVVVGPGEPNKEDALDPHLIRLARAEGVVFHGEGSHEEMPALYAALDLFVLASRREGMPRSAIEASAMRLPVVATDIRGCREVVDDGETGRLVPARDPVALAEAIGALLEDRPTADAMGAAGRERALERFDEAAVVDRTLQVYRRLMAARRIPFPEVPPP
jgi:glycosyltransferase involved in cell wall biosynthesis